MAELLKDTPIGQLIRLVSQGRFFQYTGDASGLEILKRRKSQPVDFIPAVPVDVEADPEVLAKKGTNVDDVIIVEWYSPTDKDNPRNFSTPKKLWIGFVIL
jgi:DHA1 family multidrug resistance protein-like MFS transporter